MRGTELIIFDCDGVLVDSEIVGINIEVDLLLGAGCEISVGEFTERFSGMSWKDILLVLEQERGIELSGALLDKTKAELDVRIPSETQAIHGVRAVLQELQYPRCVCSNTKLSRVEAVLTNVDLRQFLGETSTRLRIWARECRSRNPIFFYLAHSKWVLILHRPLSSKIRFTVFRALALLACRSSGSPEDPTLTETMPKTCVPLVPDQPYRT